MTRMTEMEKSIQIYAKSIQELSETMYQVRALTSNRMFSPGVVFFPSKLSQELGSIKVSPADDIISEGKSNIQTTEIEILVYDIYVGIHLV